MDAQVRINPLSFHIVQLQRRVVTIDFVILIVLQSMEWVGIVAQRSSVLLPLLSELL